MKSYGVTIQMKAAEQYFLVVLFITGAQPKAGTGLKMPTVRFFNVTLSGIYR